MSILHPSPPRREIKNSFIGLSPPSSLLSIATFSFEFELELLFYGWGEEGWGFLFPFFGFALDCSDLTLT